MQKYRLSSYGWLVVIAAGLTSLSHSVVAAETTANSGSAAQSKTVDPNKKVCKKIKPTGSHLSKRVCLKKKEWDAIGKEAREAMRNISSDSRGSFSK